jgi:hypothetical protein
MPNGKGFMMRIEKIVNIAAGRKSQLKKFGQRI